MEMQGKRTLAVLKHNVHRKRYILPGSRKANLVQSATGLNIFLSQGEYLKGLQPDLTSHRTRRIKRIPRLEPYTISTRDADCFGLEGVAQGFDNPRKIARFRFLDGGGKRRRFHGYGQPAPFVITSSTEDLSGRQPT
ncbi:hypothetical protein I7I51_01761 [Histoplasma capsulatum]|uniref:Uncharacterized protein n=1 Tax=Ajellomyces capsulatus TaxID=5037 RepID=A0A8A1MHV1_AJECA|nr:hypothetical protein I7I51_01761 [Histoplasma capsulatum]